MAGLRPVLSEWCKFFIVLPGIDGRTAAEIGERIRAEVASMSLEMPPEMAGRGPTSGTRITRSLGVGEVRPFEDVAWVISRVDQALYRAECEGRNRISMGQENGAN